MTMTPNEVCEVHVKFIFWLVNHVNKKIWFSEIIKEVTCRYSYVPDL